MCRKSVDIWYPCFIEEFWNFQKAIDKYQHDCGRVDRLSINHLSYFSLYPATDDRQNVYFSSFFSFLLQIVIHTAGALLNNCGDREHEAGITKLERKLILFKSSKNKNQWRKEGMNEWNDTKNLGLLFIWELYKVSEFLAKMNLSYL